MIETGTAKVGMYITCPDGDGTVEIVIDQDNVMVRLKDGIVCKCDLEKCTIKETETVK